MNSEYVVEMNNICKSFSGVVVLDGVNFSIRPGEVRALVGENGAGKSTLMKILGGIIKMDSGEIKINGETAKIETVEDARNNGISIMHQEISLVKDMSIAENLFLGREKSCSKAKGFMDFKTTYEEAQKILNSMDIKLNPRMLVRELSIAQQQLVEISRSLTANAKIIVMDEPTASLTDKEIEHLFEQINELKKANVAIIYISHRMEETFKIADTVTVLRDGKMIKTAEVEEVGYDQLIKYMCGREITQMYNRQEIHPGNKKILEVKNLSNQYLKDISFEVREGEILGFSGLVGAGRTELARAIFGIDNYTEGEILLEGKSYKKNDTISAISNGIALVPEDRKSQGLILKQKINFNMTITVLERFMNLIGWSKHKENEIINKYIHSLSIKMASGDQKVQELSGGNQQKVVISKWLAVEPKILILDEPTRGVDVGAKAEIYQLMFNIAKTGVAIIMISSELPEILNMSNRIAVMYEGRLVKVLDKNEDVTQEKILFYATGEKEDEK